jgi:hypothetical protein
MWHCVQWSPHYQQQQQQQQKKKLVLSIVFLTMWTGFQVVILVLTITLCNSHLHLTIANVKGVCFMFHDAHHLWRFMPRSKRDQGWFDVCEIVKLCSCAQIQKPNHWKCDFESIYFHAHTHIITYCYREQHEEDMCTWTKVVSFREHVTWIFPWLQL